MRNKQRGKYFEDRIASIIRETFHLNKNVCHRFYESGMAHGEFGDIKTPFPWIIECKYYKDISLDSIVPKQNKQILQWLKSLQKEALNYQNVFNVKPLQTLVFSKPRSEIYVMVKYDSSNDFLYTDRFMLDKLKWYAITSYETNKYVLTSFTDFVLYAKNNHKKLSED